MQFFENLRAVADGIVDVEHWLGRRAELQLLADGMAQVPGGGFQAPQSLLFVAAEDADIDLRGSFTVRSASAMARWYSAEMRSIRLFAIVFLSCKSL